MTPAERKRLRLHPPSGDWRVTVLALLDLADRYEAALGRIADSYHSSICRFDDTCIPQPCPNHPCNCHVAIAREALRRGG